MIAHIIKQITANILNQKQNVKTRITVSFCGIQGNNIILTLYKQLHIENIANLLDGLLAVLEDCVERRQVLGEQAALELVNLLLQTAALRLLGGNALGNQPRVLGLHVGHLTHLLNVLGLQRLQLDL